MGDDQQPKAAPTSKEKATKEKAETFNEFPLELTEMFDVQFGKNYKKVPSEKEGWHQYTLSLQIQNVTTTGIPGPVRFVVRSTGIKGLKVTNFDGLLTSNNDEYFEFTPGGEIYKKGLKSKPRVINFMTRQEMTTEQQTNVKLTWAITRESGSSVTKIQAQNGGIQTDSEKLMAEKNYSYAELNFAKSNQLQLTNEIFAENYAHKDRIGSEIYGTAIIESADGQPAIAVYGLKDSLKHLFPTEVAGTPVVYQSIAAVTAGPAWHKAAIKGNPNLVPSIDELFSPKSGVSALASNRFERPVPIGSSIANVSEDCYSGTLGCRGTLTAGGGKVFLTNNHVIAELNQGTAGEKINQPSTGDNNCKLVSADEIGQLRSFVPMVFTSTANNLVDAALGNTTIEMTSNASPTSAYGTPSSTVTDPVIDMRVMKYGRTTNFTRGKIRALNVTVQVGYGAVSGRFINQFSVVGDVTNFGNPGDSGSLIVTESSKQPVGLLFAGGGDTTYANPIKAVLSATGITIDGGTDTTTPVPAKGVIKGYIWIDANKNGLQEPTESPLSTAKVSLFKAGADKIVGTGDDTLVNSTFSDDDGVYFFTDISDSVYYVEFEATEGYTLTLADQGTDDTLDSDANATTGRTIAITILNENTVTNVDCGMIVNEGEKTARIGNLVWLDTNKNGLQDFGEPGIPGATIELYKEGSSDVVGTVKSNARGFYCFEELLPGRYYVIFTLPYKYKFTTQNAGSDFLDSDVKPETARTETFVLETGRLDFTRDCGVQLKSGK